MPHPGLLPPEAHPCINPLLTWTCTGDPQPRGCFSLCGPFGSWCASRLFELSECLWRVWGLMLKSILPLPPSSWDFFVLGHRVSPHNSSSTEPWPPSPQLQKVHGATDMGSPNSRRRLSNGAALVACGSPRVYLCALPQVLCFSHMCSPPF